MARRRGWTVRSHRAHPQQALAVGAVFALVTVAVGVFAGVAVLPHGPVGDWMADRGGQVTRTIEAKPPVRPSGPPTRLHIARIGLDSPLVNLGLDARGVLKPPTEYDKPGWYAGGTTPGDVGPAVVAGHVDSTHGAAVFYRLHELRPGDLVEIARGAAWVRFQVVSVAWYPKDQFPTAKVYGPTPDAELRLITCGGTFNQAALSYVDNVVVYAVEVGSSG